MDYEIGRLFIKPPPTPNNVPHPVQNKKTKKKEFDFFWFNSFEFIFSFSGIHLNYSWLGKSLKSWFGGFACVSPVITHPGTRLVDSNEPRFIDWTSSKRRALLLICGNWPISHHKIWQDRFSLNHQMSKFGLKSIGLSTLNDIFVISLLEFTPINDGNGEF